MKLTCPSCFQTNSLELFLDEPVRRHCLQAALRINSHVGSRCDRYLALFRPKSGRALSWDRVKKLLDELDKLISAGWVEWDRQPARNISPAMWGDAVQRAIEPPPRNLPLKNHNYLKTIAYDIADKSDWKAEKTKIKQEQGSGIPRQTPPTADSQQRAQDLEPLPIKQMFQDAKAKQKKKRENPAS